MPSSPIRVKWKDDYRDEAFREGIILGFVSENGLAKAVVQEENDLIAIRIDELTVIS